MCDCGHTQEGKENGKKLNQAEEENCRMPGGGDNIVSSDRK
jgi:hypothetical protein